METVTSYNTLILHSKKDVTMCTKCYVVIPPLEPTLTSSVVVLVVIIFVHLVVLLHNLLNIPAADLFLASACLCQRLLVATLLRGLGLVDDVTFLATCNVKELDGPMLSMSHVREVLLHELHHAVA
jgi:hypothetical protein